jgi:hypothetical protein
MWHAPLQPRKPPPPKSGRQPLGRQPRQQNRRRGAEASEARKEIPHVSKRTTNWIDSNVEILFMALVKVIEDMKRNARDDAERFTEKMAK